MKTKIKSTLLPILFLASSSIVFAVVDQVGYSFNQGPGNLPVDRVVDDFYLNVNGTFAGNIIDVPFVSGFTNEPNDFAFRPVGTTRVTFDVTQVDGFSSSWSSFTAELNFQINSTVPNFGNLLTFDEFGSGGTGLAKVIRDSANSRLRITMGNTNLLTSNLVADTWYHFALTYDASENEIRAYLNGVAVTGSSDGSLLLENDPDRIAIAGNFAASGSWTAPIDDFRFTNRVLEPSEFLTEGFGEQIAIPEPRLGAALLGLLAFGIALRRKILNS